MLGGDPTADDELPPGVRVRAAGVDAVVADSGSERVCVGSSNRASSNSSSANVGRAAMA
jgi:hypothetical protein